MAYTNQQQHYPPAQYDDYNPYAAAQPHQTYEQGGYNYDNGGYNAGYSDDPSGNGVGKERERSTFERDPDDFIPNKPRGPKNSRSMRRWRMDNSEGLWTRGGALATFGRLFCCTIMIAVFLFISVVLSLALWVRPPSVLIGTPTINSTQAVSVQGSAIVIALEVNASINNPNYFSVELTDLTLDLFYPINNTDVGGGEVKNVDFKSHETTNFTFPLNLEYNITGTSNTKVLVDLATKCGVIPGTSKSDITVDYTATVGVRILAVPVKPTISSSFSFECPIDASELEEMMEAAGISIGDLGSLL
ncbi:hypothetical protein C8Q72DRAFT_876512 [Fomitopsis betulina]|nr:hypothetical protein C8Q72DRAFT_876512 [Fomitopsis betulina]